MTGSATIIEIPEAESGEVSFGGGLALVRENVTPLRQFRRHAFCSIRQLKMEGHAQCAATIDYTGTEFFDCRKDEPQDRGA